NELLVPGSHLHTYRHEAIAREARPGQFVNILPSGGTDPLLRRPFSICTVDPEAGTFTVLVKVVGHGTRLLGQMPPGTVVDMLAPLGLAFEWQPGGRML